MAKRTHRLLSLLCCLLLLLPALAAQTYAEDAQTVEDRPGDLTILFRHKYELDGKERDIPGVQARVFKVASMDETGAFSLTEDFSGYTLDPAVDLSAEQWMALADAMGRYADGRGLSPLLVKTGGDDGTVTFEQLEPGLYLFLFGEGVHPEYDHIRVGFKTTLMSMPYRGYVTWNEDGLSTGHIQQQEDPTQWDYAFTIIPKPREIQAICRLQKVWDDSDNRDGVRPRTLQVEIEYEDGVKQTVALTAEDGWLAEIEADSQARVKTVQETEIPAGYRFMGWEIVGSTVQLKNSRSSAELEKLWVDNDDADKLRPRTLEIAIAYEDGKTQTVTLSADNNWKASYIPASTAAVKTVTENDPPEGYAMTWLAEENKITVTNVHEPIEEQTEIRVEKRWDDKGYESSRPQTVEVQLMVMSKGDDNGQIVEIAKLSAANDWKYTFKGLDKSKQYGLIEKNTPKGYTPKIEIVENGESKGYVITNVFTPPPTPTPTPPPSVTPAPTPAPPAPTPPPKLPQTGMLWWPVPVLLVAGAALMLFGWLRRRYGK